MKNNEIVIQYMAIENPDAPGFYEQWSCVGKFQEKTGGFEGAVFNYDYSQQLLDSQSVVANGDNINYQTYYHPQYVKDGAWTMAAS